jgi:glycosyltransferase involved in cell wall biosynthesis
MSADDLAYAVVTPARNERSNLERLSASLAAQEQLPETWMVVDDGSDDGTLELARELAATHSWIACTTTGDASGLLSNGRRQGRALESFRHGVRALSRLPDVVVKVDADTSFEPGYFRRLLAHFAAEPDLGIAGGACYELENGEWVRQKVLETHPRGASRAYRRDCLDTVMTLEAQMGWDGLDEVKAALAGYRSRTLLDLGFRHHRMAGARETGRLRHGTAQGRAAWYMGYRPSYVLLRTLYRMPRDPGAVGMVLGYLAGFATRQPRCPEPDAIRLLRNRQRFSSLVRRGAPP